MKKLSLGVLLSVLSSLSFAAGNSLTVYKDPNCGCCKGWVNHLREEGFDVTSVDTPDMASIKTKYNVPPHMGSCHTAVVDKSGQVVEGHVPATAIKKLILQANVKGVAVPGMPMNSPGMGKMDGNLVTVDFTGKEFSKD